MQQSRWWTVAWMAAALSCSGSDRPLRTPPAPGSAASVEPPAAPRRSEVEARARSLLVQAREARKAGDSKADELFEAALALWEHAAGGRATVVGMYDEANTRPSAEPKIFAGTRDGRVVAQAWGNSIAVFDASAWRLTELLEGHAAPVMSIGFSGDGTWLFSSSLDGTVRQWNVQEAAAAGSTGPMPVATGVAMSPDGAVAAYQCGPHVCFWQAGTPAPQTRQVRPQDGCLAVRHWLDANTLVTGEDHGDLCLLDPATGAARTTVPFVGGYLAFASHGSTMLASVLMRESVRAEVWDGSTGRRLHTLDMQQSGGQGPIRIEGPPTVSPDGSRIAAPTGPREVTFWSATTGAVDGRMTTRVPVGNPVYVNDGRLLLPHWRGRSFDIAASATSEPVEGFTMPALADPELSSPSGSAFLLLRTATGLAGWSLASGRELRWHVPRPIPGRAGIRCSANGDLLALPSSNQVLVVSLQDGRTLLEHAVPPASVLTAATLTSTTPPKLVTVSSEVGPARPGKSQHGTIELVNLDAPQAATRRLSIAAHLGAQLSRDGAVVATVASGQGVVITTLPTGRRGRPIPIAGSWMLSPDGRTIVWAGPPASGSEAASTIRIVDVATGAERLLAELPASAGPMTFYPDGSVVVCSSGLPQGGTMISALDVRSARTVWQRELPGAASTAELLVTDGGTRVLARDRSGRIHVLSAVDGAYLFSLALTADGLSWFAWDAAGKVETGGVAGDAMLACKVGMRVLPFDACEHRMLRKGLVSDGLRGK
jgi:hypothetical protein